MTYQLKHPFLGLLIGALFGGCIVSLWFSVPGLISGLAAGEPEQTLQELRDFMPTVMIIATQKLTHIMCMTLVLEPSLPEPNSAAW